MLDKMRKTALLLMVGLAVATVTVSPVAAASRPTQAAVAGELPGVAPNVPWADAPLAILYNQYDNSGTISLSSQDFESVYNAYDDQLADDFNVPANTSWKITGMGVQGFVTADQPASFNVYIYTDDGVPAGMPGTLRITRSNLTYTLNGTDQYRIKVSPAINIPASGNGRHLWVSAQAVLNFLPNGSQWYWTDRLVVNNMPAKWQNPNGGFGICPNWDSFANCFGGQNDGDDLVWLLVGTSTP